MHLANGPLIHLFCVDRDWTKDKKGKSIKDMENFFVSILKTVPPPWNNYITNPSNIKTWSKTTKKQKEARNCRDSNPESSPSSHELSNRTPIQLGDRLPMPERAFQWCSTNWATAALNYCERSAPVTYDGWGEFWWREWRVKDDGNSTRAY